MKKMAIITATDVLERTRNDHVEISFKFIFDSQFYEQDVIRDIEDYWGYFYQKEGEWLLSYGNNSRGGFGGGIGRVEEGFNESSLKSLVENMPEMVILMERDHAIPFKRAFEKYFEIFQFDYQGELTTS
jgi:hypothetical protein